jgi:hypothetical protein
LENNNINVELNAQQAEHYFPQDTDEESKANTGEWKTLKVDKSKIPGNGTKTADDSDRKKKLLILAKAKIKIAQAKQK